MKYLYDISKKTSRLLMILIFCIYSNYSHASVTRTDTIPTPKTIVKLKQKVYNIFHKTGKDTLVHKNTVVKKDSIKKTIKESSIQKYWTIMNKPEILITQTSFVNWSKGGNNSIAGIASFDGSYNYKKDRLYWINTVTLKYGLTKENSIKNTQKTDDIIDLKSTVGYKASPDSKWSYSGEYNLTTQFAKGYNGNSKTTLISDFFAPARMRTGIGAVYTDDTPFFKLHISPLTNQTTFVFNQALANKGAFGVTPAVKDKDGNIIKKGKNVYVELGALVQFEYKTLVMDNINLNLKSSFYSNYLRKFGNINTDIELDVNMKVNKFVQAKIGSHLLYNDNIKTVKSDGTEGGAKIQLKQILGVGVTYLF